MPDNYIGADVQRRTKVCPSSDLQSTITANVQNTGDAMSVSSIIPEPPQSDHPSNPKSAKKGRRKKKAAGASTSTPANAEEIRKEKGGVARANALRKRFPTMQNIPFTINASQKQKLILRHTRDANSTLQPTHSTTNEGPIDAGPALTTQSRDNEGGINDSKQRKRAALLKRQYPNMKGIPPKISKQARKKLVAQYNTRPSALDPAVTVPTSSGTAVGNGPRLDEPPKRSMQTRSMHPADTSGTNQTPQFIIHLQKGTC